MLKYRENITHLIIMMRLTVQKERKVSSLAKAQNEIETYLNAGQSLQRWEYFMKAMTITPSSYRNGDLSYIDVASDLLRFDKDRNKVLLRIARKYGPRDFSHASVNIYNHNRDFISQYFELKQKLPRS